MHSCSTCCHSHALPGAELCSQPVSLSAVIRGEQELFPLHDGLNCTLLLDALGDAPVMSVLVRQDSCCAGYEMDESKFMIVHGK